LLNLISVISDPLLIISENGDIEFVNAAMIELLRLDGHPILNDNVSRYLSAEAYSRLVNRGIPAAKTKVFRSPVELIDARHQTHSAEASLISLGDNPDFPDCFAILLDDRASVVRKAYGLNVSEVPHKVRVRDPGTELRIEFESDGMIRTVSDTSGIMKTCGTRAGLGNAIWSLGCWSDQEEFESEIKRCLEYLERTQKQYMPARMAQEDGETVWLELCITKGKDESYLLEGYDVTSRVIAELGQRQYTERLAQLTRQLITAQESERRRIAQELHDQIGQLLTALRLGLHSVHKKLESNEIRARLDVSMGTVDKVLDHVRSLSLDLRPAMLDDLGLAAALKWFGARQSELTGLNFEVFTERLERRLPSAVEVACFRIVQEAVSNAMRHSQSEDIHITMLVREDILELQVEDFGIGFDSRKMLQSPFNKSSVGLESMQQRVALAGGKFDLDSIKGRGSRVRVRIPINL